MSDAPAGQSAATDTLERTLKEFSSSLQTVAATLGDTLRDLEGALRRDIIGELGKTRSDIMGKVAELQDGITGMRDDLTVTLAAADSVRRAHSNTREEMRDIGESVSALYRKLARLETQIRELKGDP